jgi:hypothetical protein
MDEAGHLAYPDPVTRFDQRLPEEPVVATPVTLDE